MTRCIGKDCGCEACARKRWPQYATKPDSEQMVGICRACQGALVSRNGATVHASKQTTCPGVIRR